MVSKKEGKGTTLAKLIVSYTWSWRDHALTFDLYLAAVFALLHADVRPLFLEFVVLLVPRALSLARVRHGLRRVDVVVHYAGVLRVLVVVHGPVV